MNTYVMLAIIFIAVLGLYIYLRSKRLSKKK
jgi:hypothetical protein